MNTFELMPINLNSVQRTTSIIALNTVSTMAQIGQIGLGLTLFPIALEAKKVSPEIIGLTSAALWLGMLLGLLVAGKLTRHLGYRKTVIIGLLIGAASFILTPLLDWRLWAITAAAIGFGTGLRWIANETWLYRLAPETARGRIVGIHETLISIATVVGPLIIVALGIVKPTIFWVAAAVLIAACLPLFLAVKLNAVDKMFLNKTSNKFNLNQLLLFWLGLGGLIAGLGGWIEGSLIALLPVYISDIGFTSQNTAWLLTLFGVGALLCQFPIGWLADHKGVRFSAKLCAGFALVATVIALIFGTHLYALALSLFIFGGIAGGLLTLGMIWAIQHSKEAGLTNNVRQVSIVYTSLSALGPMLTGFIVSYTSSNSLFWQLLLVVFVLLVILLNSQKNSIKN